MSTHNLEHPANGEVQECEMINEYEEMSTSGLSNVGSAVYSNK